MSVAKVVLLGVVSKEVIPIPSKDNNVDAAAFCVTTSEKIKDETGKIVVREQIHNIKAKDSFGKLAISYLKKGLLLYLEGSLVYVTQNIKNKTPGVSVEIEVSNNCGYIRALPTPQASQQPAQNAASNNTPGKNNNQQPPKGAEGNRAQVKQGPAPKQSGPPQAQNQKKNFVDPGFSSFSFPGSDFLP